MGWQSYGPVNPYGNSSDHGVMLQLPLPTFRPYPLPNSAGAPFSSTNAHGGGPPTFTPSRFTNTFDLPQALPRLPPTSAPTCFPTTSS